MKNFRSFIKEETSLDTHMRYHEAGIPLPDRDDITEYPGGNHGYSTGPDTFAVHSVYGSPDFIRATIHHYESTHNGDVLHNNYGPAVHHFTNSQTLDKQYFLHGQRVTEDDHEKLKK